MIEIPDFTHYRAQTNHKLRKVETDSERTLNGQTADFFPYDDIWANRENSFEIIEMLDREYDLVMIFELLNESLVLMAHALCIPLSYVTVFQLNNMRTTEVRL